MQLHEIGGLLGSITGLTFPPSRQAILRRAIQAVLAEYPAAAQRLARELEQPGAIRDRLIELVTIGETYFFRDRGQLDALQGQLLAPLVASRATAAKPHLRVWSAACASGEEAYTVAVLVAELLASAERWDVTIVGSDIDGGALRIARAASYDRWSFRAPLEQRERWFPPLGGSRRRVSEELLPWVRFVDHNLAAPSAVPPSELGGPADVVLLRNVLLYLDPGARERAISVAHAALAPGGWLVVAPIDVSTAPFHGFERVSVGGGVGFRRPPVGVEPVSVAPKAAGASGRREERYDGPTPAAPSGGESLAMRRRAGRRRRSDRPAATSAGATGSDVAHDLLATAWRLADSGDLEAASRSALAAQKAAPGRPGPALCLATIAEARGDVQTERSALRDLLRQEPNHPAANLKLAMLDLRTGSSRLARARLRSLIRLVEPLDPYAPLADLPDSTVADVQRVATALLGRAP